jgi:hypothetical protein
MRACVSSLLQVPIVNAGGLEMIVAAARAHVGSVDVLEHACMALANLAVDAAYRVLLTHMYYGATCVRCCIPCEW